MNESLIESSFKYCEELTRKHYENFPVASVLLPRQKRRYIYSIYAYARAADDFADEPGILGGNVKRLALIDEWNGKLKDAYNGKAYDPIFIALGKTVADCKIPIEPLENLLKAFRQDVVKQRFKDYEELLKYCEYSANPVGRLVLMIFGDHDEEKFFYSDKICTALQLTNFWQDISVDLKKNRVYLPEQDMLRFGYSYDKLLKTEYDGTFKELLKYEVDRTRNLFIEGSKLIQLTTRDSNLSRLAKELRLTIQGGIAILSKIKDMEYNTLSIRPVISKFEKFMLVLKTRF